MNIRIEKQDMQTAMLIETDLDQIVAENFGDICEASNEAAERLCQKLNISVDAAQLVLKTPLSGLDKMLDFSYLDSKIEQHMGSIQAVIWPLFSC